MITLEQNSNTIKLLGDIPANINKDIWDRLSYEDTTANFRPGIPAWQRAQTKTIKSHYSIPKQSAKAGFTNLITKLLDEQNINYTIINKCKNPKNLEFIDNPILYNYQQEIVKTCLNNSFGIIDSPTASGKGAAIAWLVKHLCGNVLITVPTIDLMTQLAEEIEFWIKEPISTIGGGTLNTDNRIVVGLVKSLLNAAEKNTAAKVWLAKCNSWVADECHLSCSAQYNKLATVLKNRSYTYGFSATTQLDIPKALDMQAIYGDIILTISPIQLIKEGYLTTPVIQFYTIPAVFTKVGKQVTYPDQYDYGIIDNDYRNKMIIKLAKLAVDSDKAPALILVAYREHGDNLIRLARQVYNIDLPFIHGQSSDRYDLWSKFKETNIPILIGCNILNTGVNAKCIITLINAGALESGALLIQKYGRALRKAPNKDLAYIHDFYDHQIPYLNKHADGRYNTALQYYGEYVNGDFCGSS